MSTNNNKYKPSVSKYILLMFAGILWLAVGAMLCNFSYHWLLHYNGNNTFIYVIAGIILALVIHHFGFLKVVDKNLGRISLMQNKSCAFSFMSCKSYLLVIVMMSGGVMLRHSEFPKQYLSVIYIGIGGALFLSSFRYFRNSYELLKKLN